MAIKDKISQERLTKLHPAKQVNFEAAIIAAETELGIELRIAQGLRTFAEQDALYAKGRTKPGAKVTNAKGGQSWHCYGLAIDVVVLLPTGQIDWKYDYKKIDAIFSRYGLTWGHAWNDNDHFEDNLGHGPSGWKWALERLKAGKVDAAGYLLLTD